MKTKRQEVILEIISKEEIGTQEMLLDRLQASGFSVTQATVSRDIKTLMLTKVPGKDGKYCYAKRTESVGNQDFTRFRNVFLEAVISVDYAGNMVVLRCPVGMANAACAALDHMNYKQIIGTLAGDDTIFVLLRSEEDAAAFVAELNEVLGR